MGPNTYFQSCLCGAGLGCNPQDFAIRTEAILCDIDLDSCPCAIIDFEGDTHYLPVVRPDARAAEAKVS